jgi:hypothetical protein
LKSGSFQVVVLVGWYGLAADEQRGKPEQRRAQADLQRFLLEVMAGSLLTF